MYLDHRFKLNSNLKTIVEMTRSYISPELYADCQETKKHCGAKFYM